MLKIDFFPPKIIEEYENVITAEVKKRNGGNDEIHFIPDMPQYKISIHDLLTADRKTIFDIDGISLYMSICSSQRYKASNVDILLQTLESQFRNEVSKNSRNEYIINGNTYDAEDKNSILNIISEVAQLLKRKFSSYNAKYAERYFNRAINSLDDLNNVLDKMFEDLKNNLNSHVKTNKLPIDLIIDYSILSNKPDLRHKLMNSAGLRTCPYCNRNYITSYGEKSTADLDHFYQKKQYPLFALSLFNFVPSCSVCNSRMKNTYPADNALYPYEEGFEDDAKFELKTTRTPLEKDFCESTVRLFQAIRDTKFDEYDLKIVIDSKTSPSKKRRIENSEKLFHLTEVYANHKQDALEAAFRTRVYCEGNYKRHCQRLLKRLEQAGMKMTASVDLEASMFADIIDYEWLMFGIFFNDEKRRYEKPLSKMIYDIYKSGKE